MRSLRSASNGELKAGSDVHRFQRITIPMYGGLNIMRLVPVLLWVVLLALTSFAHATTIDFTPTEVSGNAWRYDYTVINDSLPTSIQEVTLFFSVGQYSNLQVSASPVGWNSLVAQPDANLPADGFYDSVALAGGIAPGTTLSGFSATFNWLGTGTPGPQVFNIVDPNTFQTLDAGSTVSAVPLPSALMLFACGILGLWCVRRHFRGATGAGSYACSRTHRQTVLLDVLGG